MTLILEIGLWFFLIVLVISIVTAILAFVGGIIVSYQEGKTEDLIFAVLGTLFLISVLLMLVGALAITLF